MMAGRACRTSQRSDNIRTVPQWNEVRGGWVVCQCHIVNHKFHTKCLGFEPWPRHNKRLVANGQNVAEYSKRVTGWVTPALREGRRWSRHVLALMLLTVCYMCPHHVVMTPFSNWSGEGWSHGICFTHPGFDIRTPFIAILGIVMIIPPEIAGDS